MSNRHYNKRTLNNAKILRSAPTEAEKILWFNLRNSKFKGIKFRRQVPVGNYIIDFLCMSKKLAIELDGSQHI